jgi:hypothetical protein
MAQVSIIIIVVLHPVTSLHCCPRLSQDSTQPGVCSHTSRLIMLSNSELFATSARTYEQARKHQHMSVSTYSLRCAVVTECCVPLVCCATLSSVYIRKRGAWKSPSRQFWHTFAAITLVAEAVTSQDRPAIKETPLNPTKCDLMGYLSVVCVAE